MPRRRISTGTKLLGLAAVAGAVSALLNGQQARAAERANPPEGKFLTVDGVKLHYVDKGRGRPVVLIHGMGAMIPDMTISGLLDSAAERYRVIAFDRPGYGHSERPRGVDWTPERHAELFARAIEHLGVERPIVVGHSWGALVAAAWGVLRPDQVEALLLLGGVYYPLPATAVAVTSAPAAPVIGDAMRWTVSPLLTRAAAPKIVEQVFAPSPVPRAFREGFPFELGFRPISILAAAEDAKMLNASAERLAPRYPELAMPVTIVAGDADHIVRFDEQSERLHRAIPHSSLVRIEAGGHMIHHISPDRVLDALHGLGNAA